MKLEFHSIDFDSQRCVVIISDRVFLLKCRQNGAPSGLENRGLDASFAFTTKQENQQKERN
ncbi:hypothetical protein QMM92_15555, partial [Leptospira santarosai]|nr:hypothetical protein [Leptospira santarosai]